MAQISRVISAVLNERVELIDLETISIEALYLVENSLKLVVDVYLFVCLLIYRLVAILFELVLAKLYESN